MILKTFLRSVAWSINWYIEHCHPNIRLESKLYRVNEIIFDVLWEKELWQVS